MKLTLLRDYPNGRYAMTFDVIIVGGSYAGISAGMQLARARRRVLVMDTGPVSYTHLDVYKRQGPDPWPVSLRRQRNSSE